MRIFLAVFVLILVSWTSAAATTKKMATFANINALSLNVFNNYPSVRPNCPLQFGPSDCPGYGMNFTGADQKTPCHACTLSCSNMNMFNKDDGKSSCTKKFFNYGCTRNFLCVDEQARFDQQYDTAISFCMVYNGCKINPKLYNAKIHQDKIKKDISVAGKTIIDKILDLKNVTFENLRALTMQTTSARFLLRFKLTQDVLDARWKNQNITLQQFWSSTPMKNVASVVPSYIVPTTFYVHQALQNIWEQTTYLHRDLIAEGLFYRFVNNWANGTYITYKAQIKALFKDRQKWWGYKKKLNRARLDKKRANKKDRDGYVKNYTKFVLLKRAMRHKITSDVKLFSIFTERAYSFFDDIATKLVNMVKASNGTIDKGISDPTLIAYALKQRKALVKKYQNAHGLEMSKFFKATVSAAYDALFIDPTHDELAQKRAETNAASIANKCPASKKKGSKKSRSKKYSKLAKKRRAALGKKKSVKKGKKAGKKTGKKVAKKGTKKSAKKTVKKGVKKAIKKVKKGVKKAGAKKSAKKGSKKGTKKSAKKTGKKGTKKAGKKSAKKGTKLGKKLTKKQLKKYAKKFGKKLAKKLAKKFEKKFNKKSVKKGSKKNSKRTGARKSRFNKKNLKGKSLQGLIEEKL